MPLPPQYIDSERKNCEKKVSKINGSSFYREWKIEEIKFRKFLKVI